MKRKLGSACQSIMIRLPQSRFLATALRPPENSNEERSPSSNSGELSVHPFSACKRNGFFSPKFLALLATSAVRVNARFHRFEFLRRALLFGFFDITWKELTSFFVYKVVVYIEVVLRNSRFGFFMVFLPFSAIFILI